MSDRIILSAAFLRFTQKSPEASQGLTGPLIFSSAHICCPAVFVHKPTHLLFPDGAGCFQVRPLPGGAVPPDLCWTPALTFGLCSHLPFRMKPA